MDTNAYSSPRLRAAGKHADVGLLAQSLLYYDTVVVHAETDRAFLEVVQWFAESHQVPFLIQMMRSGHFSFLHYTFQQLTHQRPTGWSLVNVQGPNWDSGRHFEDWFLQLPRVRSALGHAPHHAQLIAALKDTVLEVSSKHLAGIVEEAMRDVRDAERASMLLEPLIHYSGVHEDGVSGTQRVDVEKIDDGRSTLRSPVSFDRLSAALELPVGPPQILGGAAASTRAIATAHRFGLDITASEPMSDLVGDKLLQLSRRETRVQEAIEQIVRDTDFPDIRTLVQQGRLSARNILELRASTARFREWLQGTAERDVDALVQYHHEVASQTRLQSLGSSTLSLFGSISKSVVSSVVQANNGSPIEAAIATSVVDGIFDRTKNLFKPWRPIVFGRWLDREARRLQRERSRWIGAVAETVEEGD